LKEIDFADDQVLDALGHGAKKILDKGEDAYLFDEIIREKAIHEEIAWVVRVYISAMAFAINPNDFRLAIGDFCSALEKLMREIATKGRLIEIPIKHELRLQERDPEPPSTPNRLDFDLLHVDLGKLLTATKAIIASEGGPGRDANRPAHKLLTDLAEIYERRTGRKISRGNSATEKDVKTTPFGRFVEAVNARIPDGFKLPNVDNLIRQHTRRPSE
jgi:hypothetical protein